MGGAVRWDLVSVLLWWSVAGILKVTWIIEKHWIIRFHHEFVRVGAELSSQNLCRPVWEWYISSMFIYDLFSVLRNNSRQGVTGKAWLDPGDQNDFEYYSNTVLYIHAEISTCNGINCVMGIYFQKKKFSVTSLMHHHAQMQWTQGNTFYFKKA